jgi:hypothetical protein
MSARTVSADGRVHPKPMECRERELCSAGFCRGVQAPYLHNFVDFSSELLYIFTVP